VFSKWLAQREYTPTNLADKLTKPVKEIARDRVLTLEEVRAVWSAASHMHYPFGSMYQLLILIGQRREEAASIRWDEINFGAKLWAIPGERTTNDKPHHVPLSDQALAVLDAVKETPGVTVGQGLVFTTTAERFRIRLFACQA
jgi:integrase